MSRSCWRRPCSTLGRRLATSTHSYPTNTTNTVSYTSRRNLRCVSKRDLSIEDELKILKNSVAFQNIDKRGATQRFYRQVFIEPAIPGNEDIIPGWTVSLDNRKLLLNGELVVLDDYRLALCIASEWESQGTEIRPDAMPLCELVFGYLEKRQAIDQRRAPEDLSIRSCKSSVTEHIETDLLLIAENPELAEQQWYELHWRPLVDWFNHTFDSSLRMKYMLMHGEEDDEEVVSETMQPGAIASMNTQELLNAYKETEIAQRLQYMIETKNEQQMKMDAKSGLDNMNNNHRNYIEGMIGSSNKTKGGKIRRGRNNILDDIVNDDTIDMSKMNYQSSMIVTTPDGGNNTSNISKSGGIIKRKSHLSGLKRFLKELDFTRLWVLDHCIQYCYSPIISLALVLNSCPISVMIHALNCPELDTHMISLDEESLKRNQTQLRLAAARVFMDSIDRLYPMPMDSPLVRTYPKPIIDVDLSRPMQYKTEKHDFDR